MCRFIACITLAALASCANPEPHSSIFSSESPDPENPAHMNLGAGDHALSPHFGYRVERGREGQPLLVTYHVQDGEHEDLGSILIDGYIVNELHRQSALACSADGRVLLYFNGPSRHGVPGKPRGLYEFKHGRGEELLHEGATNGFHVVELPIDALQFGHPTVFKPGFEQLRIGATYVRRTDGREHPIEASMR